MGRVLWVTDQVRWRKGRGGGVNGSVVGGVDEYFEGRRRVIGVGGDIFCFRWVVVWIVGCGGVVRWGEDYFLDFGGVVEVGWC